MRKERDEYQAFTKPAELHKAINTLRGIVAGIRTDAKVDAAEVNELVHWCALHEHLRDRHPFSEILPVLEAACEDGVITKEESEDILWVCSSFADSGSYYDAVTSSVQFLSGLIHGIMADGEISEKEVAALQSWVNANDFLTGTYPYDEITAMVNVIMADKKVDEDEKGMLLSFLSNIIDFKNSLNLSERTFVDLREKYSVPGVCAIDPEIIFDEKVFCVTGESYRGKRTDFEREITARGGVFRGNVSPKTDYLVVGNAGNPCWAYACYGRKIEKAMALRKEGEKVLIVNETDFWKAIDGEQGE